MTAARAPQRLRWCWLSEARKNGEKCVWDAEKLLVSFMCVCVCVMFALQNVRVAAVATVSQLLSANETDNAEQNDATLG